MKEERQYPQRVRFSVGDQKAFIEAAKSQLDLSYVELARLLDIHPRTLQDWRREKSLISLPAVETLSRQLSVDFPANAEVIDPFWYTSKGGVKGWKTTYRKYGKVPVSEEYRKRKWYEWWEREGRLVYQETISAPKPFKQPRRSIVLAEFAGIMIGDGGMSRYQVCVTLNSRDDKEYACFVQKLMTGLFEVPVSTLYKPEENTVVLTISRTALVQFCNKQLGLMIGNKLKQGLDIPKWILRKEAYKKACLRGMMDTDGGIYHERHKIKGKIYSYPRLSFVTASPPLASSAFAILKDFDFHPKLRRGSGAVQLENKEEIRQYFKVIGSNNPKHLRRFLVG